MKQNTREILQRLIQRLYDQKQYRPVVVGVVYDQQGNILVAQSIHDPTAWMLPQGGIHPQEALEERLTRELQAEVGILPTDIDTSSMEMLPVELLDYEPERERRRGFAKGKAYFGLMVPYRGSGELTVNPEELAAAKWVTPVEALDYFRQGRPEKAALLEKILAQAEKKKR